MARIGIDLDGVCYDFAASLKHYLVECDGNWSPEDCPDPTRWEFYLDWGMGHAGFVMRCNRGVDAGVIFTHGDPYPGTREALQQLRDAGHTVHIITDRSFGAEGGLASRNATLDWLIYHGLPYDTLDFTADKTSVPTDYMIDDKIENYDALNAAFCDVSLLDRPWNQDREARNRVESLDEFVKYVLDATNTQSEPQIVQDRQGDYWHRTSLGFYQCSSSLTPDDYGNDLEGATYAVLAGTWGPLKVVADEPLAEWEKELLTPDVATDGEIRTTSSTGGQKGVKPQRHSLVPALPLAKLAEHYAKGAEKYDSHQWRKGYEWSKSFDALQRHAWAWWEGEDLDPETGSSHVAAVAWHAFALLQYINDYPEFDDRPNTVTA